MSAHFSMTESNGVRASYVRRRGGAGKRQWTLSRMTITCADSRALPLR